MKIEKYFNLEWKTIYNSIFFFSKIYSIRQTFVITFFKSQGDTFYTERPTDNLKINYTCLIAL